jgi:hypothetical protein
VFFCTFLSFDFFVALVKRLSVRGNSKTRLKNHDVVRLKKSWPNKARTLAVFVYFFLPPRGPTWIRSEEISNKIISHSCARQAALKEKHHQQPIWMPRSKLVV